jgi:hypothetical protein
MANTIREALNATGMQLPLFTGGMSKVGIGVSGTWTGTITFSCSQDGIRFVPVSMTPFASGTAVQSVTANGNWEALVNNNVAFMATFTRLTGTAVITMSTSVDASYQNAFLASTSLYVNQASGANATNTLTIAAQANRAWRLRTLVVSSSVVAVWASSPAVKVTDGASSVIWGTDLATAIGANNVPLPADPNTPGLSGGGLVNTPGNSLVITVVAVGGSGVTQINAEVVPA